MKSKNRRAMGSTGIRFTEEKTGEIISACVPELRRKNELNK